MAIIEHGAGAVAGAAALGGTLAGAAGGMQAGVQMQKMKEETRARRFQLKMAKDGAALEEQQRIAQSEWDQSKLKQLTGIENVNDVPAQAKYDDGKTDIPGVQRPAVGLTDEEMEIFNRMAPDAREEILEGLDKDRQEAGFQANVDNLKGRLALMGSGQGPYVLPEGGAATPAMQGLLEEAQNAVNAFEEGYATGKQTHDTLSKISSSLLNAGWQQQDAIETGQALYGALETARAGTNPADVYAGNDDEITHVEKVITWWVNGEIDGKTARALSGLGVDGSNAVLGWAMEKVGQPRGTLEGGGLLSVRGVPGRQGPGAAGAPAPAGAYEGDDQEVVTDNAADPSAAPGAVSKEKVHAEARQHDTEWKIPNTLKPDTVSSQGVKRLRGVQEQMMYRLADAFAEGDKTAVNRWLDTYDKDDPRLRTLLSDAGSSMALAMQSGSVRTKAAMALESLQSVYDEQVKIQGTPPAKSAPGESPGDEGGTRYDPNFDPGGAEKMQTKHNQEYGAGVIEQGIASDKKAKGERAALSDRKDKARETVKGRKSRAAQKRVDDVYDELGKKQKKSDESKARTAKVAKEEKARKKRAAKAKKTVADRKAREAEKLTDNTDKALKEWDRIEKELQRLSTDPNRDQKQRPALMKKRAALRKKYPNLF